MSDGNSLIKIDVGDLSKPLNTLIEKISGAIEGIAKPRQIIRIAKAEAEADIIRTEAQVKVEEIQNRTLTRLINEETKKQYNMESIIEKSFPEIKDDANPEKLDDDWIVHFFDRCRLISDEDMQLIWGKILAGETNNPGRFSKRTLDVLSSLDKYDAELFNKLRSFCIQSRDNPIDLIPIVFDTDDEIYKKYGITYNTLKHLNDIGLITFESFGSIATGSNLIIQYGDNKADIKPKAEGKEGIIVGIAVFTKVGSDIASMIEPETIPGFFEYIIIKWFNEGHKIQIL